MLRIKALQIGGACAETMHQVFFKYGKAFVSDIWPNPKKLAVVSQYGKNTYDFSFLPSDYSVQFVDLDRVQSKQEFIDAIERIEKDRVVVNLIDNCEDEANVEAEKYFTSADADVLKDVEKENGKGIKKQETENNAARIQNTLYRVSGLTAIECYKRLGLAFTGASARNFAIKKTALKTKGVSTPKHIVVYNRTLSGFSSVKNRDKKTKSIVIENKRFPLRFPVIVKPLKDYGGSTFIQEKMKCSNMKELMSRIKNFPVPEMIIEEFIVGEEHEILIFDAAVEKSGICARSRAISRLKWKHNDKLRKLAHKLHKVAPSMRLEKVISAIQNRAEQLADKKRFDGKKRHNETKCIVTHPNQVVLPSADSFQHEELKWRALNAVCEKVASGKTKDQFMLKYRQVSQNVFRRSGSGTKRLKELTFTKDIISKMSSEIELRKLQQDKIVRDAYLNRAIKQVARQTWKLLKHDGYFRYDFRVVEEKVLPPLSHKRISAMIERCGNNLASLPKNKLVKLLPQYVFRVYVIDANPYCSVFGVLLGDADKLLVYTPYLSHKMFLDKLVRAGILRELRRREAKLIRMNSRSIFSEIKNDWAK